MEVNKSNKGLYPLKITRYTVTKVQSACTCRQLIFLRKSDCLGCAVLLCLVCLTLLASFFLPSHLSFKTCIHMHAVCNPELHLLFSKFLGQHHLPDSQRLLVGNDVFLDVV